MGVASPVIMTVRSLRTRTVEQNVVELLACVQLFLCTACPLLTADFITTYTPRFPDMTRPEEERAGKLYCVESGDMMQYDANM